MMMISEDKRLKNELVGVYDAIIPLPKLTEDGDAVDWLGFRFYLSGQFCPID